jgi:hypothetical protein
MNIKSIINFRFKSKDTLQRTDDLLEIVKDLARRQFELAKDVMAMQVRMKALEGKLVSTMENNMELIKIVEKGFAKMSGMEEDKDAVQVEADDNKLPDRKE